MTTPRTLKVGQILREMFLDSVRRHGNARVPADLFRHMFPLGETDFGLWCLDNGLAWSAGVADEVYVNLSPRKE
jgi:hypothetical protein